MTPQQFYEALKEFGIELTEEQKWQLHRYFELLVEWNEKMNLTGITEVNEVYLKHFYDSLLAFLMFKDIHKCESLCDVGSGAGFPALPVKIVYPHLKMDLVDSLGKRVNFLNHVIAETKLQNIKAYHSRAEEYADKHRESFDIVTARAVARLNVLSELCVPLVKEGGFFIALKGQTGDEELKESKKALETFGVEIIEVNILSYPKKRELELIFIQKNTKRHQTSIQEHTGRLKISQ